MLLSFQDEQNEALDEFKTLLSNFKPKQSLLEHQIEISRDVER